MRASGTSHLSYPVPQDMLVILTHTEKQALIWARMAGLRHNLRHTRSRRLFCPAIVPNHCPRGLRGGLLLALGCARPKKIFKNFLLHVQHAVHIKLAWHKRNISLLNLDVIAMGFGLSLSRLFSKL